MGIGMLKQQQATKTFEVRSGSLNTTQNLNRQQEGRRRGSVER